MNGQTIRDLCELDFILSSQFQGVYSFDNLPMHVCKYPSAYIVNTASKRSSSGEHWLALYFSSRNHSCVFDSYGRNFSNLPTSIQGFISHNSLACSFNTRILQQFHSQACGLYSILFLFYMSRLYDLGDYLSIFLQIPERTISLCIIAYILFSINEKLQPSVEHSLSTKPTP